MVEQYHSDAASVCAGRAHRHVMHPCKSWQRKDTQPEPWRRRYSTVSPDQRFAVRRHHQVIRAVQRVVRRL